MRRAGAGLAAASTFDPSGNLAQRLDGAGNVLGAYAFDAFGLRTGTDSTTDPYVGFGSDRDVSFLPPPGDHPPQGHRLHDRRARFQQQLAAGDQGGPAFGDVVEQEDPAALDQVRRLHRDRRAVQGACAGAAEKDAPDRGLPHQAGRGVNAPVRGQPLGQGTRRPEGLIGPVGRHGGEGDIRQQERIELLEQALQRPLTACVQGRKELCPAGVPRHGLRVGVGGDVVAAPALTEDIQGGFRRAGLPLRVDMAQRHDAGGLIIAARGGKEEVRQTFRRYDVVIGHGALSQTLGNSTTRRRFPAGECLSCIGFKTGGLTGCIKHPAGKDRRPPGGKRLGKEAWRRGSGTGSCALVSRPEGGGFSFAVGFIPTGLGQRVGERLAERK